MALLESTAQVVFAPAEELFLKYTAPPVFTVQLVLVPAEALLFKVMLAEALVELTALLSPVIVNCWVELELFTTPLPLSVKLAGWDEVPVTVNVKACVAEFAMVILPTVMAGVGSVPLIVGVKLVALLSNVATSVAPFGKFPVQFALFDQTLLVPPSQVAESACAGAQSDARTAAMEAVSILSRLHLGIIRGTQGTGSNGLKGVKSCLRGSNRPQTAVLPQFGD